MTFHNEQIPKLQDEPSEFFKQAREKLRLISDLQRQWTIDRSGERVLYRTNGGGADPDTVNFDFWSFVDRDGLYRFRTNLIEAKPLSPKVVKVERTILFLALPGDPTPTEATIESIKEALKAFKDYGLISKFEACELVLTTDSGEAL